MRPTILTNEKIVENCKRAVQKLGKTEQGRELAKAVNVLFPKSYTDMNRMELFDANRSLQRAAKTLNEKSITEFDDLYGRCVRVTEYLIKKGYQKSVINLLAKYGVRCIANLNYLTGEMYIYQATNLRNAIMNEERIRNEINIITSMIFTLPLGAETLASRLVRDFGVPDTKSLKVYQLEGFRDSLYKLKTDLTNNEPMNKPTTANKNYLISGAQSVGKNLLAELMNGGTYLVEERSNRDIISFSDVLDVPKKILHKLADGVTSDKIIVDECNTSHKRFNEVVELFKKKYKLSIFITQDAPDDLDNGLFDFRFTLK